MTTLRGGRRRSALPRPGRFRLEGLPSDEIGWTRDGQLLISVAGTRRHAAESRVGSEDAIIFSGSVFPASLARAQTDT